MRQVNFDETMMHEALALAARGRGAVEPNPMVGAVLVRDGQVIGRGWHHRFGGPHAEIEALADCRRQGHDPAGATLYVTLEPCSHIGKTPPCADALVAAKLARVVVAMVDPFEQVAGRGLRRLRDAGVDVALGVGEAEARELNGPFVKRVTRGLPWVMLKWAQTLDGKIATATGDSRWISNDESRRQVHALRSRVDAIMVGIGTALADDPQLTARDVPTQRVARRVVVDPHLRLSMNAKLVQNPRPLYFRGWGRGQGEGVRGREEEDPLTQPSPPEDRGRGLQSPPVTLAVRDALLAEAGPTVAAWRQRGVELVGLPDRPGASTHATLDLAPLLRHLADVHQATNVLVEGGAGLAGSLLEQGLVDQVLAFVAPKLAGDPAARSAVAIGPCASIAEARGLVLHAVTRIGDDVLLDYRVKNG